MRRIQLFVEFDGLFKTLLSEKVRDSKLIFTLREKIVTNYSDSSVIYYASRRLSKFLSIDVVESVRFQYERAEFLMTRFVDLYNIYLIEIQND